MISISIEIKCHFIQNFEYEIFVRSRFSLFIIIDGLEMKDDDTIFEKTI